MPNKLVSASVLVLAGSDLIMDNSGNVTTAVVGAGGFLGAGQKDVAVPFKDLKVARDGKDWLVLDKTLAGT
jgi:PRC-barrel domain